MQRSKDTTVQANGFIESEGLSFNKKDELGINNPKLQVAQILEKLGEFGRLHYRLLLICILASISASACTATLIFAMKEPTFKCKDSQGYFYECNQAKACSNPFGYTLDYKVTTLVIAYNTYCDRRWMKIWGQSIVFITSSLLSTLLMCLFEKYGRKTIFMIVAVGTTSASLALILVNGFWPAIIFYSILWACAYLFTTNFYVYSTEIFNGKWRSIANSIFFFATYGSKLFFVVINIFFRHYLSNYWLTLVMAIPIIPLTYFLIDTPYYYHKIGDKQRFKENLEYINYVNNYDNPNVLEENKKMISEQLCIENLTEKELAEESITQTKLESKNKIFDENFTLRNYIYHLMYIIITIIPNYIGSALGETVPYKLGLNNIYISSAAIVVVLIITNIMLIFYLHKIPRRKGSIVCASVLIGIPGIFLLFKILGIQHKLGIKWAEFFIMLFAVVFGMLQFVLISRYINEIFPTKVRAISIALALEVGRTSSFLANLIDPWSEKLDIHPFVIVGMLYIIALPFFFKFEETLHTLTKN